MISNLRIPSGSNGARHHAGAFGGGGPESGELTLHSCKRMDKLQ